MLDVDKMESGRWYTLQELPGFTADCRAVSLLNEAGEKWCEINTPAFLMKHVRPLLYNSVLRAMYRLPDGQTFAELQDVPRTFGDPPRLTGLDDVQVVWARNDHD